MKNIILASSNKGKLKEFNDIFSPLGYNVLSFSSIIDGVQLPMETGSTFQENAAIKAEAISVLTTEIVLADDSGLVVDALDGAPGIYSARFAGEDSSDENNNKKLLKMLRDVPIDQRSAKFVCVIALARQGSETVIFKGECRGKIGYSITGLNGFGYDPLFIEETTNKTFGELNAVEKNNLSHRGHALKLVGQYLEENINANSSYC